jgi:hypothetical protein
VEEVRLLKGQSLVVSQRLSGGGTVRLLKGQSLVVSQHLSGGGKTFKGTVFSCPSAS